MKKLEPISLALICFISTILFVACSKQENEISSTTNSLKVEGIIAFNTKTKKTYLKEINNTIGIEKTKESFSKDYEIHLIKSSFKCNNDMPYFTTEKELKSYLIENNLKTNGVFELYIDNELVYSTQIKKGKKINEVFTETAKTLNLTAKYPCSYAGIKACAIEGIHNQNWYQMALCISEGFGCVAEWYLNCTIDNC